MKLNSLEQIALLLGLECSSSQMVKSFAFDSREVAGGSLFFALTGEKADGHHFLEEVAQRGAVGAVVSKGYSGESFGLELLKLEDVVESLHLLAKKAFEMRKGRVVAITGSVGKTTTKEFLATLLEEKFSLFKTHASQNSRVTVPIQLLNLMEDKEIYLVEMAMTEPGQIARLAWMVPPEIAMVTAVAPAHIAGFKEGLMGIARAKAEIFSRRETRLGVIGPTAARFDTVVHAGSCPKIVYGEDEERYPPMNLPFTASHLRENFFGAAVVARELGMSWEEIAARAKELRPFTNRFEIVDEKGVTFVRDCFNANPYSMEVAFKNLPAPRGGRTIGVIGSMESSPETFEHHRLIGEMALGVFDELLCIGEECMPMVEIYHQAGRKAAHFSNLKALKQALAETAHAGDVVLVKGSNRMKLWELF